MPLSTSYMPQKQPDQVVWSQRFVDVVCANSDDYGVPAAMATGFVAKNAALKTAWALAIDPATRTKANVATKDFCLADMKFAAKPMISIIQGTPGITDAMLINAGLTVRKTTPTKRPVPTVSPFVEIVGNVGRTLTVELRSSRTKRGKPANVTGAIVFKHVGEAAPTVESQWQYVMNTTLTSVQIPFPPSATGGTVWITCFWQNAKGESGPAAAAVSFNLPAGGVMPSAAATAKPSMRLRAAA